MGNSDALARLGPRKDYVRMQWIDAATRRADKICDRLRAVAVSRAPVHYVVLRRNWGSSLRFRRHGVKECCPRDSVRGDDAPASAPAMWVMAIDPQYFRPRSRDAA